jgi:hypothetical protein
MRRLALITVVFVLAAGVRTTLQEPVINRGPSATLTGEVVDISCYKEKGVAAGTGKAHIECAKMCVRDKGASLGILTDGDGLFRLWGDMSRDNYAKLVPYIGQTVEITGNQVTLSNNYDVRSFEVKTIKASKGR